MVRQAGLTQQGQCLDLCCGTGDIAERLARAVPQGQVIGADFSAQMLQCAQQRLTPFANVILVRADALQLPFPSQYFDAVTIGYGLRNLQNLEAGIQEIWRVLKPGGVLVSLDVGKVKLPGLAWFFHLFFFYGVPWIGKRLSPNQEMFDYLPHSSVTYPSQETLKRMMLQLGFQQVDILDFMFGLLLYMWPTKEISCSCVFQYRRWLDQKLLGRCEEWY